MKTYTITAITKANRTEYFHAVTVEAENVREAKEKASAIIRATLNRHAFRIANATAPASIEHAQWIADRFNTTVDAVMQAASRPEGVDAYDFEPATVEAEPEPARNVQTVAGHKINAFCIDRTTGEQVYTIDDDDTAPRFWTIAEARNWCQQHAVTAEAENPITPGNAPLYVWTFANGAESAAILADEATSAADAAEYARAARTCANEATEAAEIAGTAEAAKDAERARIAADLAEQAAQQVAEAATICDADAYDNRAAMYAAAAVDEAARYDATEATDAETARAISAAAQARETLISRVNRGMTEADAEAVESSDYAATLTNEAFTKAGINPAAARAEADRAARAFIAAYEIATGESIATNDPEAAAAQRVARHDVAHEAGSTAQDRFLVDEMVSDIADEWARTAWYREEQREAAAAHAAEAIEDAREVWTGPDYYRIGYSDGGMDATSDGAIWYETAADLIRDLRSAYESATDTHLPYAERIERPAYQRCELEAFIGSGNNLQDYDVEAIEAEATEYDPATSRTVWRRGIDLGAICERHEVAAYYPAAV